MEKEQILSEITTRIGKTSLSQRTLTDYVSSNLPTEGAEPDDAFWEKHVGFLKSLDGNFSHDVSTQVEEFKRTTNLISNKLTILRRKVKTMKFLNC
ncbi:hypothetical protein SFC43_01450 [Bacteroides sp. CR5/BHMF/2]|nr:hypothetical protein [Bacteroides sp. CR5/BHMF/2]